MPLRPGHSLDKHQHLGAVRIRCSCGWYLLAGAEQAAASELLAHAHLVGDTARPTQTQTRKVPQ